MTRAQSFKALVGNSIMDRIALMTYQPRQSLNHRPIPDSIAQDMADPEIDRMLNRAKLIRQQNF